MSKVTSHRLAALATIAMCLGVGLSPTAVSEAAEQRAQTALFWSPEGIAIDGSGTIYVAEYYANTIKKITPAGMVTTFAGHAGLPASKDGPAEQARFNHPSGLAVDAEGNVFVADTGNHTIRKITPAGVVTTVAGLAGSSGSADGAGSAARFNRPSGIAIDGDGDLYVADTVNRTIRKVTAAGVTTTIAGTAGKKGAVDGSAKLARFDSPSAVAIDSAGNIYVADTFNNTIRKITPAPEFVVTTLAGTPGFFKTGSKDGIGKAARFDNPVGLATDSKGNIYVADWVNATIRRITPAGEVTTLAGVASPPKKRNGGKCCAKDGAAHDARFAGPYGLASDAADNIYVADTFNCTIRKITPDAQVSTIAGVAGVCGFKAADGPQKKDPP